MEISKKSFLFYISLFVKYTLIVTLPLGETETNSIDFSSAFNDTPLPSMTIVSEVTAVTAVTAVDDDSSLEVNYDGRIVGGQVTSIVNHPYQVSLQYHRSHICGGSILTHNVILTAAHCIEEPQEVASFQVRAGSVSHLFGGQLVGVRHIIKHAAYGQIYLDSDVALVVLDKSLTFTRTVKPIELPHHDEPIPAQQPLLVSGWGLTSETGAVSSYLNYVAVRFINRSTCARSYQYVATITRQMFCAGHPQGGKDSCQGDSGGPLVSYVATKPSTTSSWPSSLSPPLMPWQSAISNGLITKPIQYGIVSWGVGCAHKDYPGVYTNVAALRPWIDEKLHEISLMS